MRTDAQSVILMFPTVIAGSGLFYVGFETEISPIYQELTGNNGQKEASLRLVPAHSPKPNGISDISHPRAGITPF